MAIRSSSAEVNVEIPRREPCVKCKLPVFLVERVIVGKQLYHSSCFRCARCDNQLTAGNYYETEIKDQYCCETCPNEEFEQRVRKIAEKSALSRSLSDEEKAISMYESRTLQTDIQDILEECDSSNFSVARSHFMQELIADNNYDMDVPPPIPKTEPPDEVVAADTSLFSYDSEISCLPNIDSLKLSVNSCDDTFISDIQTKVDFITKENNENVKPLIDNMKSDPNTDTIIVSSDDSVIVISDDSETQKSFLHDRILSSDISDRSQEEEIIKSKDISATASIEENELPIKHDDKEEVGETQLEQSSLNPFGDENEDENEGAAVTDNEADKSSKSLNPFGDDEDQIEHQEQTETISGAPQLKAIKPRWSAKMEFKYEPLSGTSDNEIRIQRISVGPMYSVHPNPAYAAGLNPFSSDEDEPTSSTKNDNTLLPKSLNPFSEDDDDEDSLKEISTTPQSHSRKVIHRRSSTYKLTTGSTGDTPENYKSIRIQRISEATTLPAPRISLNPFSSDEDEPEEGIRRSTNGTVNIDAQFSTPQKQFSDARSFGSSNSIASSASASSSVPSTLRKKKPAPKPPIPFSSTQSSPQASITSSPSTSAQQSPRPRKAKRAPLPPTSTPAGTVVKLETDLSPVIASKLVNKSISSSSRVNSVKSLEFEKEKVAKDEANRQTQSGQVSRELPSRDKSTYGKWKRKKGQAPSLPVPQKRAIKALPILELKKELDIIEVQLQGLSKQGVRLEKIIRDQCEGPESDPDATKIPIEAEDLILQLFEVVNEKNELCRRQAELMYLKRQHRLEEEQAEIEYQIRCLMLKSCKTDSDKTRETELIERYVEIVNLRAEIVECLEMDRVRTVEEDDSVAYSMNTYAQKREEAQAAQKSNETPKKGKKKFKKKLLSLKRFAKLDVDKDIDESETNSSTSSSKSKGKKKK